MGVSPFFVRMDGPDAVEGDAVWLPSCRSRARQHPLPRLVHPARKKCRLTDRLWVVSASLDDCKG